MKRSLAIFALMATAITAGCDSDWGKEAGALSRMLPKDEITGCYRAGDALPIIRVEPDRITSGDRTIYSSYNYGLGGRNSEPLLLVRPRMALQRDAGGTYSFKASKQALGSSFSYSVTRQPTVSIQIFSQDAEEHRFVKVACR